MPRTQFRAGQGVRAGVVSSVAAIAALIACSSSPHNVSPGSPAPTSPSTTTVSVGAEAPPPRDLPGAMPREAPPEAVADLEPLTARYEPRQLAIPQLATGRSATFTFDGRRTGWFARLPEYDRQQLLTPAYGLGKVYVGGGFGSTTMYGIDAKTGRIGWSASAPDGGPTSAIVEGDRVLYNTESCTLFVNDAKTGRLLWSRWLGDPLMSQPAAADGRVFSGHIKDGGGYGFTAMALDTGRVLWTRSIDSDVLNAPVLDDHNVYFTTMGGQLYAMEQATGRVLFRKRVSASSAPWLHDGTLHLAQRVNERDEDGRNHRRERTIVVSKTTGDTERELDAVDAAFVPVRPDGEGVPAGWSFEGSRPTIVDGRSYQTIGNEVQARDADDGRLLWRRRYTERTRARPASSPAIAGSQLVFGTQDGVIYGLDIDTGLTTFAYRVGEPIAAQPTVAHGWVYASTTRGGVVGLHVGDASMDGWHMWGGNAQHNGPVPPSAAEAAFAHDSDRPTEGSLQLGTAPRDGELAGFPLEHTKVTAHVSGFVTRVTVEQTFTNPYSRPVEAVYLFPLPGRSAVDAMQIETGTRVVHGEIRRREEARREYQAARQRGVLSALLEQERPDLFRQSIANVRPGDSVKVTLEYTEALPYQAGSYRFVFPMVAGPRYTPQDSEPEPSENGDVSQVLLAPGGERPDRVEFAIEIDAGTTIGDVTSPTHDVTVAHTDAAHARITLAEAVPDRDLDVRWEVAGGAPSLATHASAPTSGQDGFVTLALHPQLAVQDSDITARELVFLLDASSSMNGAPMTMAKAAIERALDGMRAGDTFRLIRFSDDVSSFDADALPASSDNVTRAKQWLASTTALGTTEMKAGLIEALDAAPSPDRLRFVMLLTDGYIGNEAEILREVDTRLGDAAASPSSARVFTFGVGAAVNRYLLSRLADVGRGDMQVVTLDESPQEAADAFHEHIARPFLTDVSIDFGGLPIAQVFPRRARDLFADQPLVLSGRYAHGAEGTITIRGKIAGRDFETSMPVTLPGEGQPSRELGSIWARTRIEDAMLAMALRPSDALREEVTTLGLTHGLLTQWTSFLAIDEGYRADPTAGTVRVNQAATLPSGVEFSAPISVGHGGGYGMSARASFDSIGGESYASSGDRVVSAPQIRAGSVMVTGALGSDVIRRTIAGQQRRVRAAYERLLTRSPESGGRVVFRLVIGVDGSVQAAMIASTEISDPTFQEEALAVMRSLTFPAVEGGGTVTVNYPIVFRRNEDDD